MSGLTPPFFYQQFFAPNGTPLSGGKLYFTVAGSTVLPKPVFTDISTTLPLPQPLVLSASGVAPQYFMESGLYKITLRDRFDVIVETYDDVEGLGGGGSVSTDDHKVIVSASDLIPGYLFDKTTAGVAIKLDDVDMGGDNHKLVISVDESLLHVPPYGPAGGDLSGLYPDPIVKQLTGIDADMVLKPTNFTTTGSPALTGIGAGYVYKGGVHVKAWSTIDFDGHIRTTIDDWKTTVVDDSLYLASLGGADWNALSYVYLAGTYNCNCWVAGDGTTRKFYIAKDILANYDVVTGKILTSAWFTVAYPAILDANYSPPNVGDIATHSNVMCVIGNSGTIMRTTDMATFNVVCASTYAFGGIATDKYGNWMAIERDGARFWKSTDDGITWALVTSLYVDGVTGPYITGLPQQHSEAYGSLLCSYDTWIAAVYSGYPGHISYAYSKDMLHWTTVVNNNVSFFSAASNGVKWYATNPVAGTTPIYQLLISEIPAHKKIVCEDGLAVLGNVNLVDIIDATFLSTDGNGKVVAGDATAVGGKVFLDDTDTTKNYLLNKLNGDTSKGINNIVVTDGLGNKACFLFVNGKTVVNDSDTVYKSLQEAFVAGAGITITTVTDGVLGTRLVINSRGNSWRLTKYLTTNYTVLDTDDTLIIRGTGVVITMPTPGSAYEGRVVTVRCAGGSFSGNVSGAIVGSSSLTGLNKLEFMCYNTGSGYFWVQQ